MSPGNMNTKLDRKLRARAVWYILLAALEDLETQRRGFCFLVNPKTLKIRQVNESQDSQLHSETWHPTGLRFGFHLPIAIA